MQQLSQQTYAANHQYSTNTVQTVPDRTRSFTKTSAVAYSTSKANTLPVMPHSKISVTNTSSAELISVLDFPH